MSDVFALFLDSRVALGCAVKTIRWYSFQLGHYQTWLKENDLTYDITKLHHIYQFLAWLREDYSPGTVRQAAAAVKTFYRWCIEVEFIEKNPAATLKRPKVPDHIPLVAARSYVEHMLDKIKPTTWLDHRDKLIIRILFSTGIRISECVGLRVADVDLEKRRLAILGKGSKVRFQPFPDELVAHLYQWIHFQRPPVKDKNGAVSPWLFFASTPHGTVRGPITKQAIYDTLKRHAEDAALDWIPPHGYRHGFAIEMLQNGASTRLVQALLGHASIQTTEKYLNLSPDMVQGMFDELWEELE